MRRKRRLVAVAFVGAAIAACLAPQLSETQQYAVVVSPQDLDFGSIAIDTTSPAQSVEVSPAFGSGDSYDEINSISVPCSDFSIAEPLVYPIVVSRTCMGSGTNVPTKTSDAAPTCTTYETVTALIPFQFHPAVQGQASCNVTLNGTFGTYSIGLSGTGTAPALSIDVTPTTINFGDVRQTTTSGPATVTVRNAGSSTLTISSVTTSQPSIFGVTGSTGNHTLAPGATESLTVHCTPPNVGAHSGTLTINSNASNAPQMNVALACRGVDANIVATPSPIEMVTRVAEPVSRTVSLSNPTATAVDVEQLTLAGEELELVGAPQLPRTIPPAGNLAITVRYLATTPREIGPLGTLTVAYDDKSLDVNIGGGALATSLAVSPDGYDFGPVCVGSTAAVDVNVYANAAAAFRLDAVQAPTAPFSFMPKPGTVVPSTAQGAHGNDLEFVASVLPTAPGELASNVTLVVDVPNQPMRELALRATGLAQGIGATPAVVDFGAVMVDTTTPGQVVDVTNCSASELAVTGARIDGLNATDFAIVSPNPVTVTIGPTSNQEFLVVMSPRGTAGPRIATLVIEHANGSSMVELTGTALGPTDTNDDGTSTYYDCSAGGAAGWPLGFALLALRRRRPASPRRLSA